MPLVKINFPLSENFLKFVEIDKVKYMGTAEIKLEIFRKIDTLETDKLSRLYYYLVK